MCYTNFDINYLKNIMEKMAHIISFMGMLAALLCWLGGYFSGARGWWFTAFGVIAVYVAIYQMLIGSMN